MAIHHAFWRHSSFSTVRVANGAKIDQVPAEVSGSIFAAGRHILVAPSHCSTLSPRMIGTAASRRPQALRLSLSVFQYGRQPKQSAMVFGIKSSLKIETAEVLQDLAGSLESLRRAVDHAGGNSKGIDDASLLRFLYGNSLNIDEAAKAFARHQSWEASFKPQGYISEADIAGELNAKKSYLQGKDKQGHPLIVTLARNHVHNKEDFDEFRRFIVFALDKSIAAASSDGKLIGIIDLKGLGYKNLDSKAFIASFDILQSHYPERIEKLYMINVPLIFNGLWKVVSPFINQATRKKIEFVDKKKLQETLLHVIDADQLPAEYGGTADFVLLQDAIVPNWPPLE